MRAGGPLNDGRLAARGELASLLKMGSWIGGDRDGNPFVTADVMRGTLKLQSSGCCVLIWRNCISSAPNCRWPTSGRCVQGFALAGRALARQVAASQRRAVSSLAVSRHLRAAHRDAARLEVETMRAGGRRSRALTSMSRSSRPISISCYRSLISNNSGVIARGRLRRAARVTASASTRQPRHKASFRRA